MVQKTEFKNHAEILGKIFTIFWRLASCPNDFYIHLPSNSCELQQINITDQNKFFELDNADGDVFH